MGSFTTLKSWISRSVLGTTEEIALLPTLETNIRRFQDYTNAGDDDIHAHPHPLPSQIAAADFRKNASGCVGHRPGQSVSHAILYLRRISAAQQPTSFFSTLSLQFLKLVRPRWSQVSQTRWAEEWGDRLCPVKITPWQNITTIEKSTSRLIHLCQTDSAGTLQKTHLSTSRLVVKTM